MKIRNFKERISGAHLTNNPVSTNLSSLLRTLPRLLCIDKLMSLAAKQVNNRKNQLKIFVGNLGRPILCKLFYVANSGQIIIYERMSARNPKYIICYKLIIVPHPGRTIIANDYLPRTQGSKLFQNDLLPQIQGKISGF